MTIRPLGAVIVAVVATSACTSPVGPTPSRPTPGPTSSPAESVASEPWLTFESVSLVAGATEGDWQVIGLVRNPAGVGARDIRIRVSVADVHGRTLAELTTPALLPALAPGASSPFGASFTSAGPAASASAQIESFRPAFVRRAALRVESIEEFRTEQGEPALLGIVSNPGPRPVGLITLGWLGVSAGAEPLALARLRYGPSVIGSGESVPFLAVAEPGHDPDRWEPSQFAWEVEPRGPHSIVLDETPRLLFDPQGRPFVLGSLRNESAAPADLTLLIALWDEDRLVALTTLAPPVPIPPGTRLAFGAEEFPGLSQRLAERDPANLRIETRIEASPSAPPVVPLEVEILRYFDVGSMVFLRATLRNPTATPMVAAALFGELRSSSGELVSAGWIAAPESLAAGAQVELTLALPLPVGSDPADLEYDLRALGTGSKAGE